MNNKIVKRFIELKNEALSIEKTIKSNYYEGQLWSREINKKDYFEWSFKLENIITIATGKNSKYMDNYVKICEISDLVDRFDTHYSLLRAIENDYLGGYLISLKSLVQAEVFDNELEQAKELLQKKYKLSAAVIAGVVLETTLRELCNRESIPPAKLDKMNADLAKKGIYNSFQQKKITSLADIRNNAAHGKDEEFTHKNVEDMIRDIENFILEYLS